MDENTVARVAMIACAPKSVSRYAGPASDESGSKVQEFKQPMDDNPEAQDNFYQPTPPTQPTCLEKI